MRLNSFKVRPPGFTRHFPETQVAAKFDIRYSGGFREEAEVSAHAVSPRLLWRPAKVAITPPAF